MYLIQNKNDACACVHVHVCLTTAVSFHQKLFTAEENKIVKNSIIEYAIVINICQ